MFIPQAENHMGELAEQIGIMILRLVSGGVGSPRPSMLSSGKRAITSEEEVSAVIVEPYPEEVGLTAKLCRFIDGQISSERPTPRPLESVHFSRLFCKRSRVWWQMSITK